MKITRIQIENFRGHKSTALELAGHHVLVGENGSRKTAVLEAINYATSPYYLSSRLDEQDFNNADAGDIRITVEFDGPFVVKIPDGYVHQHIPAKTIELGVKRRERAAPRKAFSDPFVVSHLCSPIEFRNRGEITTLLLPTGVTLDELPNSVTATKDGFSVERKSGTPMSIRSDTLSLVNELVGFPNVFYFDRQRERETKTGFNSLFSKIVKDLNWRYRKGWSQEQASERWSAYYESVINIVDDKKKRELLVPLREQLTKFLGQDLSSLEISLLNIEQPFSKGFLSFREGSNQVDLEGAGSGISMLVALMLLEQVGERAGDDLILLIDEPELHLHPQLQLRLAQHFHGTSAQTIVTTHSPLFVDLGNWRGISRMTPTDTYPKNEKLEVRIGSKTIADHLEDIPAFYYNETTFRSNDSELFFAKKVLLVEGPVEKYGLPRLAHVLDLRLEQLTIVSCNGKGNIPHYATVCQAYEIPAAVLFDLDGKNVAEAENARVIEASNGFKVHYFQSSFEDLLGVNANAKHKASTALEMVDNMRTKGAIPKEIQDTIAAIADWCDGTRK